MFSPSDGGLEYVLASKSPDFYPSGRYFKYKITGYPKNPKLSVNGIKAKDKPLGSSIDEISKNVPNPRTVYQEGKAFQCQDCDTITAASYNLRYDSRADYVSGNGWDTRKFPLADVITKHHLDIIGTQEGDHGQMHDLMKLLPGYDFKGYEYGREVEV